MRKNPPAVMTGGYKSNTIIISLIRRIVKDDLFIFIKIVAPHKFSLYILYKTRLAKTAIIGYSISTKERSLKIKLPGIGKGKERPTADLTI